MMWTGLLAGFLVLGCTHTPTTTVVKDDNVTYLKAGERQPAQVAVTVWHPAVFQMDITKDDSRTMQGMISQEMVWQTTETQYETGWVEQERTFADMCSRPKCQAATGQSELWNAYFSAPKEKKGAALANAIEGIGDVSAQALVKANTFSSKPRSWEEFANKIDGAAAAGVIKKSVATMVTDTHQSENMNKLGYGKGACTIESYRCDKTIVERVAVKVPVQKRVEKRSIINQRPVEVRANVRNAKLLSFEKDQVILTIDEQGRATVDANGYNRYAVANQSISGNTVNVDIVADSRVLRDLPGNIVLRDRYELIAGKPTFNVDLDPAYFLDAQKEPNAQFVIEYSVYTCEYSWAGCWGSWKKAKETSAVLSGPKFTINADVPVKNKSYIAYRISRQNSEYFNAKATYERSSDSIKMPKY